MSRENLLRSVMSMILGAGCLLATTVGMRADEIKIGLIGTYSGPFARFGQQYDQAIAVFQKLYGDTVNGHKIVIVKRDDGGPDAAKGRQLAEDLILREKVQFLTGFTWTPNTAAAAQLITQTKTPSIIFNAATGSVIKASPYFVRPTYTLGQSSVALAQWAIKNNIKNVVTIVADYAAGHETEQAFLARYKELGGNVLESIRIPLSATDFSPFFERARAKNPDAVFGFSPNSIAEVNTWAARLKPAGVKLMATNEVTEVEALSYNKDAVGAISGSHYTETNKSELNQKFRAELVKMFGKDAIPDQFSIGAFDGMRVIYEVIRKLGPKFSPDEAMKAVQGMQFESPRGRLILDNERDAVNDIDVRVLEERDGRLVNSAIDTVKSVKPVK